MNFLLDSAGAALDIRIVDIMAMPVAIAAVLPELILSVEIISHNVNGDCAQRW